jgi:hypothetical protein
MIEPVVLSELEADVPISAFEQWAHALCGRYLDSPSLRQHFIEKRGVSKVLQDELLPLARMAAVLASSGTAGRLQMFPRRDRSYDAQRLDAQGRAVETIEITVACNGYRDAIAAETLLKHRYAPLYSDIPSEGTRRSRSIPAPSLVSLSASDMVEEVIELIRVVIQKKVDQEVEERDTLLVAFDDFRLLSVEDFERVSGAFPLRPRGFTRFYLLGLGGNFRHALTDEA